MHPRRFVLFWSVFIHQSTTNAFPQATLNQIRWSMDNQMLKHLLLSFLSKLTCFKIINKPHLSSNSKEKDAKCFENLKEWIPVKTRPRKTKRKRKPKKTRNPSPPSSQPSNLPSKLFLPSFPLDLSTLFTSYLENKERINVSLVNTNSNYFASSKPSFFGFDLDLPKSNKFELLYIIVILGFPSI